MLPFLFFLFAEIRFEPSLRLEPPEDSGIYIQNPRSAGYHRQSERTFVLDMDAKRVYVWDGRGTFLRAFGEPGEGPGQLALQSQGFLTIVGDRVLVYDGMVDKLHFFDIDGVFVETIRFSGHRGQDRFFRATRSGHLLIDKLDLRGEEPTVRAKIYNRDREVVGSLPSFVDRTWVWKADDQRRGLLWDPTADHRVLFTDTHTDEIIVANGESWFDIYNLAGEKQNRVTFTMEKREITPETHRLLDRQVAETERISERVRGEYHPRYDMILPYLDKGYVVARYTYDHRLDGIFIDREGETLGTVDLTFGELGGMDSLDGRLIRSVITEEGEFDCAYVRPVFPGE